MKQHRILGADANQAQEYYEQTVLQVLQPKLVTSIACAQTRTIVSLADGNVYEFPRGALPRLVEFPERARGHAINVAAGEAHFVALTDHLVWNVYTWGQPDANLLGRDLDDENSARNPRLVRDLPGRVGRVSCGSEFTLCATVTGDMWAFGSEECCFGQPRTPGQRVMKLPWGSEGDRGALRQSFSACGRFGVVFKTLGRARPAASTQEVASSADDGLSEPSAPSPETWFEPASDKERLILKHALNARVQWRGAGTTLHSLREETREVRTRVSQLQSRAVRHESQTEADARVLIPFIRSGDFALGSVLGSEAPTDTMAARGTTTTAGRISGSLEVRRRQVHLSRIRDGLDEERVKEREQSAKDAAICARRLAEGMALLDIIKRDAQDAEEELLRLERAVSQAEVAAREWRTQAVLLERALLRLKRERRVRGGFVERTGECRVFPVESFGLKGDAVSLADSGEVVWIRARLDPDWGRRLCLIRMDITLSAAATMQGRVSRVILCREPLRRLNESPAAVIPAKIEWSGKTCAVHLQRHAIFEVAQVGEDAYFFAGFEMTDGESVRAWMNAVEGVAVRAEGDAEVAARLMDEVNETGVFSKPLGALQSSTDWDRLTVEVAAA